MRIIISPAKTMTVNNDVFVHRQMPKFIEESKVVLDYLQGLSYEALKSIWKSSDNLAKKNFARIENMDLYNNLTPAIFSYEGLQYQYMGASIFTNKELDYVEEHLRILSGFYGILRPFDGIVPYRLEMQAKFQDWDYETLYEFWHDKIAKDIFAETQCIINLASVEYSKVVSNYLPENTQFINCVFGELIEGRVIQKATLLKMARGEMIRFMAENNIERGEDIKGFDRLDYVFKAELSDAGNYVFIKR